MTRYDMAQAMYNTVVAEGMALPTDEQREAAQAAIGDFASVPEDYESAVVAMYALGYLSGVNASGDFGGEGAMTRAQSCVVMSKLLGTDVETAPETPDEGATGSAPIEEETPAEDAGSEPADTVAAYEQEVFDLVNQIRAEMAWSPLCTM